MNRYQDYSLQNKLVAALIICIVIPLTALGVFLNSYVERNLRKKEYQINQTRSEERRVGKECRL